MKFSFLPAAFVSTLSVIGCKDDRPQITPSILTGEYTYSSVDGNFREAKTGEPGHLSVKADGTFELVGIGERDASVVKVGHWSIKPGDPPDVLLDHDGYPIKFDGKRLQLVINEDLGESYLKVH